MCPDNHEPTTIVLPTLKQSVTLPPETAAIVWDAVDRGIASSPEEYIHQALHHFLTTRVSERARIKQSEN
jgi:Arc/MetJ-type ribon-helix-helix transcriptional regulator